MNDFYRGYMQGFKDASLPKQITEYVGEPLGVEPDDLMIAYMSGLHDGKKLVDRGNKPCQTCEALARTVMLDQSSHDTTPYVPTGRQQRPVIKPLTDARLDDIYYCVEGGATPLETWREQARAIEAAHGITSDTDFKE